MMKILENLSRRSEYGGAALLVVDTQNDFLHPSGLMTRQGLTKSNTTALDCFLQKCRELIQTARTHGIPVFYVVTALRPDHSDSSLTPAWRERGLDSGTGFLTEGSWGAQIVEELAPAQDDYVLTKKGHGAFFGTTLDLTLSNLG